MVHSHGGKNRVVLKRSSGCLLLFAGSDTTANTVAFAVYLLSKHGGAETKMVAEIDAFFERIARVAEGEVGGRPTFDDLHEFPYVEQVGKLSPHPLSISARSSSIHSESPTHPFLSILTSCTGVAFILTSPRLHVITLPLLHFSPKKKVLTHNCTYTGAL